MHERSSVLTCAGAANTELPLPGQIRAREARWRTVASGRIEPKKSCSSGEVVCPEPAESVEPSSCGERGARAAAPRPRIGAAPKLDRGDKDLQASKVGTKSRE